MHNIEPYIIIFYTGQLCSRNASELNINLQIGPIMEGSAKQACETLLQQTNQDSVTLGV